jgi:Pectate lyase superfamily protein/Periplasmic copper-binding protein (NosD)
MSPLPLKLTGPHTCVHPAARPILPANRHTLLFLTVLSFALRLSSAAETHSVHDHGARGDGHADDTAAIQRAVDAGTGAVFLPRGNYRITRPIVIDLARIGPSGFRGDGTATLIMAGPGPALSLKGSHRGTADPQAVTAQVTERERAPLLDGFTITGTHADADGIRVEGTFHGIFSRLFLHGLRHGIVLTGRNRNILITEVNIYHNTGIGILLEKLNLHQVNIANSHISYNHAGGIVVRDSEVRNLQIGTCDIEANMVIGGPPTANVLFDTRTGSIREGALTGSTLQHSGKASESANIRFIGQPDAPLKVGFFSIANNHLSDTDINIHLRHARGVTISGNTFGLGFAANLLVEGCSNISVGPNTMDQNPDYDQPNYRNTVIFEDSADSTIHGLLINRSRRAEASFIVRRSHHFQITDLTILDSDGIGLMLDQVEWSRVSGCLIHDRRPTTKNAIAIKLTGGRNNQVTSNLVAGAIELAAGSTDHP